MLDRLMKCITWLLAQLTPRKPSAMPSGPVIAIVEADGSRTLVPALAPGQPRLEISIPMALADVFSAFQVLIPGDNGGDSPIRVSIDGWSFATSPPGEGFSNVILLKFVNGSLRDLVAEPTKWNGVASAGYDARELSQWLGAEIDRASPDLDSAFAYFNDIAHDPNWFGILILQMTIVEVPIPLSSLSIPQVMAAHHLGFPQNKVTGADDDTSMASTSQASRLSD